MTTMTTVLANVARRVRTSGGNPALTVSKWPLWPFSPITTAASAVTDASALGLPAFYRGVSLLARTLGGLPVQVFHEEIDGNGIDGITAKIKTDDTRYLWMRPNPEQTKQSFWERIFADEVRGNAFIYVDKADDGTPINLWHIARRRVRVGRTESGRKVYEVDDELPMIDYREGGEIVHIPNWGEDIVGYDPVSIAAESIALGISAQEYAARSVSEGSIPPGIVSTEGRLSIPEAEELSRLWSAQRAGVSNQHKVKFMGNGAKFQQTRVDPDKMQLESLRKFQMRDIATLLGLPPFLLGDMDHASQGGGNGLEEQNRNLIQFNFQAHISAVEQAVSDALLVRELTNRYMRFNLEGLLRGTTLQRYQAYAMGYGRWLTAKDIRGWEDMPDVDGADLLLAAMNMVSAGQLGQRSGVPVDATVAEQVNSAAILIRSGFKPPAALEAVGLDPIEHFGLLPVTLQSVAVLSEQAPPDGGVVPVDDEPPAA